MQCVNHPDAAATGICTRCDQMLCAQCVEDRSGRTFCQKCAQFLDQRAAGGPLPGAPVPPPPPPGAAGPAPGAANPYSAPGGDVYQGPAPGGDVYQGPAPGGDVYQGSAPGGDVYQGSAPEGDMYQGPAGDMNQGDVYQGGGYSGVEAPAAEPMSVGQFYFSLQGRISVGAYWLKYQIPYWAIYWLLIYFDTGGFDLDSIEEPGMMTLGFTLLSVFPALAVNVKRLHDRGRSGWFLLISLIPFIGGLWLFVELAILGGTPGDNQYGEEP